VKLPAADPTTHNPPNQSNHPHPPNPHPHPPNPNLSAAYEAMLNVIHAQFGDQPQDVLRGAADEVLTVLKNQHLTDPARQKECGDLLGAVADERFAELVAIGKLITDWVAPGDEGDAAAAAAAGDTLDQEIGVAVEFEDEEEEEGDERDEVVEEDEDERDTEDEEEVGRGGVDLGWGWVGWGVLVVMRVVAKAALTKRELACTHKSQHRPRLPCIDNPPPPMPPNPHTQRNATHDAPAPDRNRTRAWPARSAPTPPTSTRAPPAPMTAASACRRSTRTGCSAASRPRSRSSTRARRSGRRRTCLGPCRRMPRALRTRWCSCWGWTSSR